MATKLTVPEGLDMSEPTAAAAGCQPDSSYCCRCDLLVGLDRLHVTGAEGAVEAGGLTVRVESPPAAMGCYSCGVLAKRGLAAL